MESNNSTHTTPATPPNNIYAPVSSSAASPPPIAKPTRRVGTFTMAICLILFGVLLVAYAIWPSAVPILTIFKFFPVILIILGVEILISQIILRGQNFKYDFLSFFVCAVLIFGTLVMSAVPYVATRSYRYNEIQSSLSDQAYRAVLDATEGTGLVEYVECSVSVSSVFAEDFLHQDPTLDDLNDAQNLWVTITLSNDYADVASFAADCHILLQRLHNISSPIQSIHFNNLNYHYSPSAEDMAAPPRFRLDMYSPFSAPLTAEQLAQNTYQEYWDAADSYYVSTNSPSYNDSLRLGYLESLGDDDNNSSSVASSTAEPANAA